VGLKRGPGKKKGKREKIGFSHFVTAPQAAFQLETYCGVSLNNQTTRVNCRQSSKHLILRASLAKRQQRGRGGKKIHEKNEEKIQARGRMQINSLTFQRSSSRSISPRKKEKGDEKQRDTFLFLSVFTMYRPFLAWAS
jgi:hypothetical protein